MKERMLFCGFYGCGNLGDDALLLSLLRAMSERRADAEMSYLSGDSPILSRMIAGEGISAAEVPRMKATALLAIRDSDTVILGGGSVLQNVTGQASLLYYCSLLRYAQLLGKRTAILAGGLGPLDGKFARHSTASVLRELSYASFRDERSAQLARSLGAENVHLSADPTLLLSPIKNLKLPPLPKRFFLVSLREKSGFSVSSVSKRIYIASVRMRATPLFCDLFPKEDAAYTSAVMRSVSTLLGAVSHAAWYLPHRLFAASPEMLLSVAERAVFVLSARYHLALFAYSAGIPMKTMGDDPKLLALRAEERTPADARALLKKDLDRFFAR